MSVYWPMFEPRVPGFLHIPAPYPFRFPADQIRAGETIGQAAARALEDAIVREGPDTVGAFIAEPVQGAGGWIVPPEGTPLRQLWRQMFDAVGGPLPPVPIECGSVLTIRGLLLRDDFLTLLSVEQLSVELESGLLVDIGPAPGRISRTIGLTTRVDWRPTRLQQAFIQAVEASGVTQNS